MFVMVDGRLVNGGRPIPIGVQTDSKALTLEFVGLPEIAAGQLVSMHGGDVTALTLNGETGMYEYTVDTDLTGLETEVIPAYIAINATVGGEDVVWHTYPFDLDLRLLPNTDAEYAARAETLLDTILANEASRTTAEAAREAAVEAYLSHPTKTENGVVQVWDSENEAYEDGEDLVAAVIAALPSAVGVEF